MGVCLDFCRWLKGVAIWGRKNLLTLNLAYAQMGHLRLGQLDDTLFKPLWWPLQMWLAALSKQGIFVDC